jgi:hypothetical protein
MNHLVMPDLFWSDLGLGGCAIICGFLLYRQNRVAAFIFLFAGISAWFGGVSHSLIPSGTLEGKIIWLLSLLNLAISSLIIIRVSLSSKVTPYLIAAGLIYSLIAWFITDDFTWAAILQSAAVTIYGIRLFLDRAWTPRPVIVYYELYVATNLTSAAITIPRHTLGLPVNTFTVFHLFELIAVIFLYLSVRGITYNRQDVISLPSLARTGRVKQTRTTPETKRNIPAE